MPSHRGSEITPRACHALALVKPDNYPYFALMPLLIKPMRECYAQGIANGLAPVEAFKQAGYSTRTRNGLWKQEAYKLREAPDIAARIEELVKHRRYMEERATERAIERMAISKELVAREFALIGFANMNNYVKKTPDGELRFDFSEVTPQQMAAVRELTIEEYLDGGRHGNRIRRTRFKLYDKTLALHRLSLLFGWILPPPRAEPPTPLEERLAKMTPDERAAEAREFAMRLRQRLLEAPPDDEPEGAGGGRIGDDPGP